MNSGAKRPADRPGNASLRAAGQHTGKSRSPSQDGPGGTQRCVSLSTTSEMRGARRLSDAPPRHHCAATSTRLRFADLSAGGRRLRK
jgi:hypothetical protein